MKDHSEFPGRAQCEVTGLWVPKEQIYKYKSWNVCDEGKAMLDLGVGPPAKKAVAPGAIRRGLSWCFDFAIYVLLNFAVIQILGSEQSRSVLIIAHCVVYGVFMSYVTIAHAFAGQTIGKKIFAIKVVNRDLTRITVGTAIKRTLYCYGPFLLFFAFLFMDWTEAASLVARLCFSLLAISFGAGLGNWSAQKRAAHDLLAGTRVIRVQ